MAIDNFTEKEIRRQIINKLKPELGGKRSKHKKGYIYLGDVLVAKVKIPNDHNRVMKESKSQYIAQSLRLNDDDFNDLIKCPLTGSGYYKIITQSLRTASWSEPHRLHKI